MRAYILTLLAATTLCSSCASIVSHSRWPVAINSVPVGANVVITNHAGQEVFSGPTPAAVTLKSGAGFFQSEYYTLTFRHEGYDTKTYNIGTSLNGWYIGNLLLGGLIGFLIVDPATGAMYRLDQKVVQVALNQGQVMNLPPPNTNGTQIVSIENVPANLRDKLVPVK